jgi:hypothetical protein
MPSSSWTPKRSMNRRHSSAGMASPALSPDPPLIL